MIANEKNFDQQIQRIGNLYEEGKDCLSNLDVDLGNPEHAPPFWRLREILAELRDIAATNLKAGHQLKNN